MAGYDMHAGKWLLIAKHTSHVHVSNQKSSFVNIVRMDASVVVRQKNQQKEKTFSGAILSLCVSRGLG